MGLKSADLSHSFIRRCLIALIAFNCYGREDRHRLLARLYINKTIYLREAQFETNQFEHISGPPVASSEKHFTFACLLGSNGRLQHSQVARGANFISEPGIRYNSQAKNLDALLTLSKIGL